MYRLLQHVLLAIYCIGNQKCSTYLYQTTVTSTKYTVSGLLANNTYPVAVFAINEAGSGEAFSHSFATKPRESKI